MTKKVINNKLLNNDFLSDAIELRVDAKSNFDNRLRADSVELIWDNISGIPNGNIEIYFGNDKNSRSFCCSLAVDTLSNKNDTELFLLQTRMRYLFIRFIQNDISNGQLTAYLNY